MSDHLIDRACMTALILITALVNTLKLASLATLWALNR